MKILTKITTFALAAAIGVSASISTGATVGAYANDTVYTAAGFTKKEKELAEKIKKYLQDYKTDPIDISGYNLSFDEFEELYTTMLLNEPSLFYVSPVSAYLGYDTPDHILTYSPVYNYTKSRTESIKKELDEYTDKLMSGIHDEWSDAEKALYVHDYIAAHAVYYDGSNVYKGRNIYDLFMKETAVCVGYAESFQYIMDKLGIPCINITNDDHIWNMVQLDSNWYHLDVTWDDSMNASPNFVFHRMMLLSEYGIDSAEPVHDPWDYGMIADSNKYDSFFWQDSCSAMTYLDGYWYYSTIDGICRYSFKTGKSQLVYKISDSWSAGVNRKWQYSFAKVQAYNGKIYFNTPDKLYTYSPGTNNVTQLYAPKLKSGYQIYDFIVEDGKITIYSSNDYNDMDKNVSVVKYNASSSSAKTTASSEKPAAPSVEESNGVIKISWSENTDAEQYIIYRYNKDTKKAAKIGTAVSNSFAFKKSDRDDNCLYAIKVRTDEGLSGYSSWVAAKK